MTEAKPSAFGNWVFEHTAGRRWSDWRLPEELEKQMLLGTLDHEKIEAETIRSLRNFYIGSQSDYKKRYSDRSTKDPVLTASRLRLDGEAFRCKPDLVLAHKQRSHFIIVERNNYPA